MIRLIQKNLGGQQWQHQFTTAATQPDHAGSDNPEEHGQNLAHVRRQQIAQKLANIVEDATPFAHCLDDGGEIVVGQYHLGRLLGDLRAGDPHGDADVRCLQRRSVVDAVASHRNYLAVRLQRIDDTQLVQGRHAGKDRGRSYRSRETSILQGVQVSPGQRLRPVLDDAQQSGDAGCGAWMVTGDHHDPDAGAASLRYRDRRFLARRVDDAHGADENQVALKRLAGLRVFAGSQWSIGDGQGAQRLV